MIVKKLGKKLDHRARQLSKHIYVPELILEAVCVWLLQLFPDASLREVARVFREHGMELSRGALKRAKARARAGRVCKG